MVNKNIELGIKWSIRKEFILNNNVKVINNYYVPCEENKLSLVSLEKNQTEMCKIRKVNKLST